VDLNVYQLMTKHVKTMAMRESRQEGFAKFYDRAFILKRISPKATDNGVI
jgi:hypothetical protein